MRPFHVGVYLPIYENEMGGETPRWTDLLALGQRAEAVGFDSIWVPDHLLVKTETLDMGPWAALPILTALAATTTRVEIGPLVSCTLFYNPALLAKMADTIDEISGGRFVLGVGAGWHEPEFRAFDYPFDRRVSRFEETLQIIAPLLREGNVDFKGKFYSARDCELRPRGPRPSGLPILAAGREPRMLGLVARYADRWNATYSYTNNTPEGFAAINEQLNSACDAIGRDRASLIRTVTVHVRSSEETENWEDRVTPLSGSPEEIAAGLRAYIDAGADQVIVALQDETLRGLDSMTPVLACLDA
jgi:alkanesulfonate monooxygenase SsuD/methylene tetrahydromethanopterin reductase-like flavin-dependent oxidoreductase (luciferase family)